MHNIAHHQIIHRYFSFFLLLRVTVQVIVIMASSFSAAFPLLDSCTKRSVPEIKTIVRMIKPQSEGQKSSGALPKKRKIGKHHIRNGGYQRQTEQDGGKGIDKCTGQPFGQRDFFFSCVTLLVPYLVRLTIRSCIKATKRGMQVFQNLFNGIGCRKLNATVLFVSDDCLFPQPDEQPYDFLSCSLVLPP